MNLLKIFIAVLITTITISAQQQKIPVFINYSGEDLVGEKLFYVIKEEIRKSSSMELSYNIENSLVLNIVSTDYDANSPGNACVYSIAWCVQFSLSLPQYYYTSSVGSCGLDRVEDVAGRLVAMTDDKIAQLKLHEVIKK